MYGGIWKSPQIRCEKPKWWAFSGKRGETVNYWRRGLVMHRKAPLGLRAIIFVQQRRETITWYILQFVLTSSWYLCNIFVMIYWWKLEMHHLSFLPFHYRVYVWKCVCVCLCAFVCIHTGACVSVCASVCMYKGVCVFDTKGQDANSRWVCCGSLSGDDCMILSLTPRTIRFGGASSSSHKNDKNRHYQECCIIAVKVTMWALKKKDKNRR